MKVYQINYDLRNKRNYQALHDRIKSYKTWCRPLESAWVVACEDSAVKVRDYLSRAMDQDDGILVTQLNGEAAWYGVDPEVSSYLKNLLERQAA